MSEPGNAVILRLKERAAWIRKEIRNGGNHEHLSAREQECAYITHDIVAPEIARLEAEIERLERELSSAQCVVRQVAQDTFGRDMTVKEFADASSYDS